MRRSLGKPLGLAATVAAGLLMVALGAEPLAAQQTGAVSGTVTSAAGQPLEGAQVVVAGTGLGTLTNASGEYRIEEVPTGGHTVRVQLVGYSRTSEEVQIEPGQIATVDFTLRQRAIEMEQIVVTGTGSQGVQRKKLGNSISSVSTEQISEAPAATFSEALSGKTAGVSVGPGSGFAGEGQRINIRGSASLAQSNEPIVYVDGIRVSNSGGFGPGVSAGASGGQGASSRLDDIDPNSIERIEILKGAAAATLYGTEASNGVIQIFTKSGREGEPRWNFSVSQSFEQMKENRIPLHADFAGGIGKRFDPVNSTVQQQINTLEQMWGFSGVQPYEVVTTCVLCRADETGRITTFDGNVRGGTEGITYFVSSSYENLDGIYGVHQLGPRFGDAAGNANDRREQWTGTGNTQIFPTDELNVRARFNFARTVQNTPQTANNIFGPAVNMFSSQLRLATPDNTFGTPAFCSIEECSQSSVRQDVDHFSGSIQTNYQPSQELSFHANFGADLVSNQSSELFPFGWDVTGFTTFFTNGSLEATSTIENTWTAELRSGWQESFGDNWSSSFTLGGQGFIKQARARGGSGTGFPGPGLQNLGSLSEQTTLEVFTQNTNVGLFAQEQIGWKDFIFVTGGARWDANSAFGEDFSGELYPKLSASVVLSDAPGVEDIGPFSSLRLKGAWGQSGLQPDAFDKFRTFGSLTSAEGPGVEPSNLGGNLQPEVTTEIEAGVEAGLLDDRLSLDVTFWDRETEDALIEKQFPPSGGFGANLQLTNVGRLTAQGVDVDVNWQAIEAENTALSIFANTAYLEQEVADMGGAPPIKAAGSYPRPRNFIQEGFAPFAFFGAELDESAAIPLQLTPGSCEAPTQEEALAYFSEPRNPSEFEVLPKDCENPAQMLKQFLGKPQPDFSGSVGFDFTFLGDFTLRSLFAYEVGDRYHQDLSGMFRQSNFVIGRNTPGSARVNAIMHDPGSSAQERLDAALEWAREYRALAPMSGMNGVWRSDFGKLREASLTYNADAIAQSLGLDNASISFRGRNLFMIVHDDYRGLDPELEEQGRCGFGTDRQCNIQVGQEGWRLPVPRRFALEVDLGF